MSGHKAVQIVTFEQNAGLTKAFLEEIKLLEIIGRGATNLPTIVISIGGVARSGKSFLLNLFVNYLTYLEQNGSDSGWETCSLPVEGVNWAQSRTAVTLGIWMWSRPFIITRSDGTKAAVLLVDSQGTGDNRRSDVKLDTLIMYISLQLSSVQVLNVEKYLTSDVMISLQLCADYADVGGIEQQSGAGDSDDFLFQSLAFVIRDYQSDDLYGEDHKAFQEIVRAKLPQMRQEVANDDLKKVVVGISKAFRNITSFNMPYPGSGVVRASYDTKQWQVKDIPGNFLSGSKEIIKKLCNLTPSQSSGTCWESGEELMANFKLLKYHLENDDLPQITSPSEALQETILYRAFSKTQKFFSKEVEQGFDSEHLRNVTDSVQLKAMFDGLVEKTKAFFKKAAKGDKYARTSIWRKYTDMLETAFKTAFSGIKTQFDFMQQIRKLEQDNQIVSEKIDKQAQVFRQQIGSLSSEINDNKLKQQEAEQIYQAREESMQAEIGNLHKMVEEANNDEEKERLREEINKHQMETQKMRAENEKSQLEHRHQMEALTNKMVVMQAAQKKEQDQHEAETKKLQEEFKQHQERMRQQERAMRKRSSGPLGFLGDIIGMAVPAAFGGIFSGIGSKLFK